MANQVTLTFAGDSTSLERSMSKVGAGAKEMAADFDKADGTARRLDGAMGKVGETVDSSESKFMGTADVLDGLNSVMGTHFDAQINMARGFGDIAGGLTNLGPLFSGTIAKVGSMIGLTSAQSAATGTATTAQWSLNSALAANPIGVVVIAIAALVAGFVLAYKNSETFRNIVQGALHAVADAAIWVKDRFGEFIGFLSGIPGRIGGIFGGIGEMVTAPFRSAFGAIKNLWNSTVGGFGFTVPGWVPGVGGKGFNIPRMHIGGVVPGNPGNAVPILAMAGETVGRAGASNTGATVIVNVPGLVGTEDQLARKIQSLLLQLQRRSGNLGFEAA